MVTRTIYFIKHLNVYIIFPFHQFTISQYVEKFSSFITEYNQDYSDESVSSSDEDSDVDEEDDDVYDASRENKAPKSSVSTPRQVKGRTADTPRQTKGRSRKNVNQEIQVTIFPLTCQCQ